MGLYCKAGGSSICVLQPTTPTAGYIRRRRRDEGVGVCVQEHVYLRVTSKKAVSGSHVVACYGCSVAGET